MKTLTVRGVKPDLADEMRRRAARQGKSVNRFIVEMVEENIRGDVSGKPREHHDLDHLFGSPSNDIWIAACTMEQGAHLARPWSKRSWGPQYLFDQGLATADKHFRAVPGLFCEVIDIGRK